MNKSVVNKWIAALRSGKYKQTKEKLKGSHGYCCLGVLCDIYIKEHKVPGFVMLSQYRVSDPGKYRFMDEHSVLPRAVSEWVGISPRLEAQLSKLNDDQGLKFPAIATYLENIQDENNGK